MLAQDCTERHGKKEKELVRCFSSVSNDLTWTCACIDWAASLRACVLFRCVYKLFASYAARCSYRI